MAHKTSAVADEPVEVLFALHANFNLVDLAGPLEALHSAQHDPKDKGKPRQNPPSPCLPIRGNFFSALRLIYVGDPYLR